MTPEKQIIEAIPNLWVERFPQDNNDDYPKGLVKRISTTPQKSKDRNGVRWYESNISIAWYDINTSSFQSKREEILTSMQAISHVDIKNIIHENTDFGYDPVTDMNVMNIEFTIKHTV